ncbi:MAG TPA: methyltransferase domain-containing protein [Solirubrobacteraceae bacterium]|jgi:ubiquinone/menaquinone biosynthesis C-methylase UbiE|nr:methyltransferase domain-containing protein [Solirubrobacteraceae bacterium]
MRRAVLLALAGLVAGALWWRRHPSACPYGQRFWVEAPHPLITRARLREALDPRPGERILEVGPGTGYYALPVARWLAPGGTLEVLDLQREMLDHTLRLAAERRIDGIVATQADATRMPYEDASMDGAYLVLVLGEIPDQEAALRELRRVVRPGGRVVVGELLGDPHWVSPKALERRAAAAGLRVERRLGTPVGYFARLVRD